jgi:hypothetical protein
MEDLEIINKVMDQHKVLLGQINSISETMSDKDALLQLDKAQAELSVNFRRSLAERRASLVESLNAIEKGLKNHYDFEEEMLPPLLGKLLIEALTIEHKNLIAQMQKVISKIGKIKLEGLNHESEISQEAIMRKLLNTLRDKKLDHQKREEAILLTLQSICQEKAKRLI